ncbi:MAG: polyamine aminopropyltransferase [Bacteroidota bacterium]
MRLKLSEKSTLIIAVFIAGLCSIVYELLISTTSSYFLGDSVKQFSLTIGVYMAAMGLGSFLSKYMEDHLLQHFIRVELGLGLIGGASVPILYGSFHYLSANQYQVLVLVLTGLIGTLTGFEIPLLTRIMKKYYPLKTNLANVLSLDYIGALAATLLFPFLLLPFFGLFRTSVAFGLLNIALGYFVYSYFKRLSEARQTRNWINTVSWVIILGFLGLLAASQYLMDRWESHAYSHQIIHAERSPYQQIVLTKNQDETRLYLNRVIQFSSRDEYRYHEGLALLPAGQVRTPRRVLILGGGEGLLAREVLRLPGVREIVVVDLDQRVFDLGRHHPRLQRINKGALDHPKVKTIAQDASVFLRFDSTQYDLILADLPDPSNETVARLYSTWFFRMVKARLTPEGVFATQAASPFHTRKAFWCVVETVRAAGFPHVQPYHIYVPSFGEWGFVMASQRALSRPSLTPRLRTKYLEANRLDHHFVFAPDLRRPEDIRPNRLDQPILLDYYLAEWKTWRKEKIQ